MMAKVGYDPRALVSLLETMDSRLTPGGTDFARTHPTPESRINDLEKILPAAVTTSGAAARQRRFNQAMRRV
jgi:predicted Zn-dependent protease